MKKNVLLISIFLWFVISSKYDVQKLEISEKLNTQLGLYTLLFDPSIKQLIRNFFAPQTNFAQNTELIYQKIKEIYDRSISFGLFKDSNELIKKIISSENLMKDILENLEIEERTFCVAAYGIHALEKLLPQYAIFKSTPSVISTHMIYLPEKMFPSQTEKFNIMRINALKNISSNNNLFNQLNTLLLKIQKIEKEIKLIDYQKMFDAFESFKDSFEDKEEAVITNENEQNKEKNTSIEEKKNQLSKILLNYKNIILNNTVFLVPKIIDKSVKKILYDNDNFRYNISSWRSLTLGAGSILQKFLPEGLFDFSRLAISGALDYRNFLQHTSIFYQLGEKYNEKFGQKENTDMKEFNDKFYEITNWNDFIDDENYTHKDKNITHLLKKQFLDNTFGGIPSLISGYKDNSVYLKGKDSTDKTHLLPHKLKYPEKKFNQLKKDLDIENKQKNTFKEYEEKMKNLGITSARASKEIIENQKKYLTELPHDFVFNSVSLQASYTNLKNINHIYKNYNDYHIAERALYYGFTAAQLAAQAYIIKSKTIPHIKKNIKTFKGFFEFKKYCKLYAERINTIKELLSYVHTLYPENKPFEAYIASNILTTDKNKSLYNEIESIGSENSLSLGFKTFITPKVIANKYYSIFKNYLNIDFYFSGDKIMESFSDIALDRFIGTIDSLVASAKMLKNKKAAFCIPTLENYGKSSTDKVNLDIMDMWNPIYANSEDINYNSISMGGTNPPHIMLCAPTGSGKTSIIRTLLLSIYMSNIGVVPARSFKSTRFAKIFQNLSYYFTEERGFSKHMGEDQYTRYIIEFIKNNPEKAFFILFDEFFSGTQMPIMEDKTRTMIREIINNPNIIALFTTHYPSIYDILVTQTMKNGSYFVAPYYIGIKYLGKNKFEKTYKVYSSIHDKGPGNWWFLNSEEGRRMRTEYSLFSAEEEEKLLPLNIPIV